MKILQLIPQFILPATDGGKIGILNISKEFSKENKLIFIFFSNFLPDNEYIYEIKKYGTPYFIVKDIKNSNSNILLSILKNKPVYLSKFKNKTVLRQIDEIISKIEFDVIHADHTSMAQIAEYISHKTKKPWGLRLHNLEHIIWKRYSDDLKNFFKKYIVKFQAKLLEKEEFRLISNSFVSFPITKSDFEVIKNKNIKSNYVISSAGVDLETNKPVKIYKNPTQLCIATTYNWIHNVNGLIWFIENVLPLVKEKIPDVSFNLYGKNIPNLFHNFKSLSVNPIGFVNDISLELSKSSIYIAPLFVGSGIRIKILEAMAHCLPVVATKVSAEGIIYAKDSGLIVTDSNKEQANIIVTLLKNRNELERLGKNAREFIEENYSWKKNVKIMLDEYNKLLVE